MKTGILISALVPFFAFGPILKAGSNHDSIKLEADWHYVHVKHKDGHVDAVNGETYERGLPWHPGITVRQAVGKAAIAPAPTIDINDPAGKGYTTSVEVRSGGKVFSVKYPFRKGDAAADTKLAPGSVLQGGISGLR